MLFIIYYLFLSRAKRRNRTTSINNISNEVIKVFEKTRTLNNDVINNDNATLSKAFRKLTMFNDMTTKIIDMITKFNDDFEEITITKRCFNIFLTIFNSKNILIRFDNVMIYLIIFSYFCTNSTILSSFDKFLQISYSSLYSFYCIKYFDFFFNLTFVDKLFNFEKFNINNIILNEYEIRLIKFKFEKKIVKKTKHNFNYTILKTRYIH